MLQPTATTVVIRGLLGACFCVLIGAAPSACGKTGTDSGSETHWLLTCVNDADCGSGRCLCGICTSRCLGNDACQDDAGNQASECRRVEESSLDCSGTALDSSDQICMPIEAVLGVPAASCGEEGLAARAMDGCNTCSCRDGVWSCSAFDCARPCSDGESHSAGDACNICECDGGTWTCSQDACAEPACDDGDERAWSDDMCSFCVCIGDVWACTDEGCGLYADDLSWCSDITGLCWERTPSAGPETDDVEALVAYCDNLELDGFSDWRTPTLEELTTLLVDCSGLPCRPDASLPLAENRALCDACVDGALPRRTDCYWHQGLEGSCTNYLSATEQPKGTNWSVAFATTGLLPVTDSPEHSVRCVRDASGMATECGDLTEAECDQQDSCHAISARVEGPDGPEGDFGFVVCSEESECGDAETCARNGYNGPTMRFRNTCIPDGWLTTDCSDVSRE